MFDRIRIHALFVMALLLLSSAAQAMSLEEAMAALGAAKQQGQVGEQPNGYLGVVQSGGNADEIVTLINAARRAEYEKLANDNGIKLADVEALAGQKAIDRTPSGYFILLQEGWTRK